MYKVARMHPVVSKLLEAKKHSDHGRYTEKTRILHQLLSEHPEQFKIDSRQSHTVGLTHKPSGFRIHMRKGGLPFEFLKKENMKKTAMFLYGRLPVS